MKKRLIGAVTAFFIVLSLTLSGCGGKSITIGSKDHTENILIGEILAQLIEHETDIKVNRKLSMGGTFVCFNAIKKGDIDLYPEYTGTGLTAMLKMDVIKDSDKVYKIVSDKFDKKFDIKWLEPYGFNNTYVIAVTKEAAEKYNLEKCSDLKGVCDKLVFGADHEFFNREDGFKEFTNLYGLKFKGENKKMGVSLKYQAIGKGDIDVTDAFATDGEIKQYDLKVLEDDKVFFPPYHATTIIRNKALKKHPELEGILNKLANKLPDEKMTDLNFKVSFEKKDVKEVAKDFLKENGLLD